MNVRRSWTSMAAGLAIGICMLGPARSAAQTSDEGDGAIRHAVESVAALLESSYVFPDIGRRYAQTLLENVDTYVSLRTSELASRLTADLQAVNQDRHLRVLPFTQNAPNASGQRVQSAAGGPAEPLPVAASADELFSPIDLTTLPEIARRLFESESRRNHFFTKIEILPGNIGYLDYDQFGFPNFSTATADAAFAFLSEADALIIDLRNNPGGIEGMNQYLASHFFGDEPVHLYSRYYGSSRTTLEYVTFPDRVHSRFPDTPLFILVNGGTGSAAENFTFAMQGLGRAMVVGESTAGAAHSSRAFPVGSDLLLQLPVARAFNPRTDQDWERVGVQPDIASVPASALAVAHAAAVDRLLQDASAEERPALEEAKLLFSAGGENEGDVDPGQYTGEYGSRRVFVEDGKLKMVRIDVSGARAVDLVPLAQDYFTLEQVNTARIRFERNETGEVARMHVRLPTGDWEVGEKR